MFFFSWEKKFLVLLYLCQRYYRFHTPICTDDTDMNICVRDTYLDVLSMFPQHLVTCLASYDTGITSFIPMSYPCHTHVIPSYYVILCHTYVIPRYDIGLTQVWHKTDSGTNLDAFSMFPHHPVTFLGSLDTGMTYVWRIDIELTLNWQRYISSCFSYVFPSSCHVSCIVRHRYNLCHTYVIPMSYLCHTYVIPRYDIGMT